LEDAIFAVPMILSAANKAMTFEEIGYYLTKNNPLNKNNNVALKKYGENHSKMAALLDLVLVSKVDIRATIKLSEFGKYYCTLPQLEQKKLAYKLCLRIPIVQNQLISGKGTDTIDKDLAVLSIETQKRRRSNVVNVVRSIMEIINP
jgi:hypothetical protein